MDDTVFMFVRLEKRGKKKEKATECIPVVRAKKGTVDHLLPS